MTSVVRRKENDLVGFRILYFSVKKTEQGGLNQPKKRMKTLLAIDCQITTINTDLLVRKSALMFYKFMTT